MNLKKKLSTILSVLGVLNMTSVNTTNAQTFNYYENFDDFKEEEDDDDDDDELSEDTSDTPNGTYLASNNQNSENTSQDNYKKNIQEKKSDTTNGTDSASNNQNAENTSQDNYKKNIQEKESDTTNGTDSASNNQNAENTSQDNYIENIQNAIEKLSNHSNALMAVAFIASFCTKIYNNSITVPRESKETSKQNEEENKKITWFKTKNVTMKELKEKAEQLWESQGYTNIDKAKSNSVIVKACNKSGETVDLCYYKPDGFFGPTYAINGDKHKELKPSTKLVEDDTELVDISEDCDEIFVQLIDKIQEVWNNENKVNGEESTLSLGDIVYIYTNLVSKLKENKVKEPSLTATWLLLGNNKINSGGLKKITDLPLIKIMVNNLPIISLLFPVNIELPPFLNTAVKRTAKSFIDEFSARLPVLKVKDNGKKELTLATKAFNPDNEKLSQTYKLEENATWELPNLNRGLELYGEQVGKYDFNGNSIINMFIDSIKIGEYSDVYGILKYLLDSFSTFYCLVSPLLDIGLSLDNDFDEYINNIKGLTSNELFKEKEWAKDISGYLNKLKSHSKLVKSLCKLLKKSKADGDLDAMLDNYVEMAPETFKETEGQKYITKEAQEKYKVLETYFKYMSDDLKLAKYLQTRIPSEDDTENAKEYREKVNVLVNYLSIIDGSALKQAEAKLKLEEKKLKEAEANLKLAEEDLKLAKEKMQKAEKENKAVQEAKANLEKAKKYYESYLKIVFSQKGVITFASNAKKDKEEKSTEVQDAEKKLKEAKENLELAEKGTKNEAEVQEAEDKLKQAKANLEKAKKFCCLYLQIPEKQNVVFSFFSIGPSPWQNELYDKLKGMGDDKLDKKIKKIEETFNEQRHKFYNFNDKDAKDQLIKEVKDFLNTATPGWPGKEVKDIKLSDLF